MASRFTLLLFLCTTLEHAESSFAQVKCSAKNVGYYGHQSLLECAVQTSPDASDAKIRGVTWRKGDEPLLVFHNGKFLKEQPGYMFAEPSWNENNMNVSMIITNTTVAHDGLYSCDVITSKGLPEKKYTRLEVQAKYSVPSVTSNPEKIIPNTRSSLICESHGGYPKGQLRWFDDSRADWSKSAEMKVQQTADGLFQLTSTLSLMPRSTLPKYICMLYNASGNKEYEINFHTFPDNDFSHGSASVQTSKILAPVLVIGSLIVGLLMALLVYRRRSQRFSTVPPRDFDDENRQYPETVTEPKDSMA
ncbi:uncharacterized protein LOC114437826 isoform X2 [Parambassis ranga]|uniref:Uncharacterized protein LOC114437826 isoform X2 n=1 Tax=Parambassis ranga TaxID=210632 RepID=A0A6P7ITY1_9TELE|nr:uncharacterized protein LOC114437826 isoform X2 [Parambassis ranga]